MALLSRSARFLTLLFALLQLTLPGALSVADAVRAVNGRAAVSHVEDRSHSGCPAPHTDACDLCRYLSGAAAGTRTGTPLLVDHAVATRPAVARDEAPCSTDGFARRSRAPPDHVI
jgi:hypothetical protein